MSIGSVQTIAIIEREYLIAIDIERIIAENFDCKVNVIMPDEALQKLQETNFDILILDADMPVEIIGELSSSILVSKPLVALLRVSDVDPNTFIDFPFHVEIAKPFTDEQVVGKLGTFLI